MKFTVSTKPLIDSLNLGIINSNVSQFYKKSSLIQISADRHDLVLNIEADSIVTELRLKGSGDSDNLESAFVDCLLFKQLVSTFEAATTTIELRENDVVIHSGSSKFTLPKIADSDEGELAKPSSTPGIMPIASKAEDWKFIKDHQMYAVAMSFVRPVYTKAWVGKEGDVIIGDFGNDIFTHSKKNSLPDTCLLENTIINLLTSLPEGAVLTQVENGFRIDVKTDGYTYVSEFKPAHETDEGVGSYSSHIILPLFEATDPYMLQFNAAKVSKCLSQAMLLATNVEDTINITFNEGMLVISNNNVNAKIEVKCIGDCPYFSADFKLGMLKTAISNLDSEEVSLIPSITHDEGRAITTGIKMRTSNMTVTLGSIDEES